MKLELATAYAASLARVASWAVVAGVVYRYSGSNELARLMLLRGTVGFLSYASLGIMPVLVRMLSQPARVESVPVQDSDQLEYYSRPVFEANSPRVIYGTAGRVTLVACAFGLLLAAVYGAIAADIHVVLRSRNEATWIVSFLAIGTLLKVASDVPGSLLQARNCIARDNACVALGEIIFLVIAVILIPADSEGGAELAAGAAMVGSGVAAFARFSSVRQFEGLRSLNVFNYDIARMLVVSGAIVFVAQMTDWLYAPVNQILIDAFLSPWQIAAYSPAIQIDGAMLLLVSGLATVLLPKTAIAHANNDFKTIRAYYIRGTLFSLLALAACAVVIVAFDDLLFRLWFKDPMEPTQAILPLVLVHTVIGGTSSIARSVLFGIGRIKTYTIAAVIGGVANVLLAILFVTQTNWGLKGIVFATIITVTVRCGIWMPWYTLRALRLAK